MQALMVGETHEFRPFRGDRSGHSRPAATGQDRALPVTGESETARPAFPKPGRVSGRGALTSDRRPVVRHSASAAARMAARSSFFIFIMACMARRDCAASEPPSSSPRP